MKNNAFRDISFLKITPSGGLPEPPGWEAWDNLILSLLLMQIGAFLSRRTYLIFN